MLSSDRYGWTLIMRKAGYSAVWLPAMLRPWTYFAGHSRPAQHQVSGRAVNPCR
jgi:hypothetical protein